jgi:hypothetical protein
MGQVSSTHIKCEIRTLQFVRRCVSCVMFRILYLMYSEIHKYRRYYFCVVKEESSPVVATFPHNVF